MGVLTGGGGVWWGGGGRGGAGGGEKRGGEGGGRPCLSRLNPSCQKRGGYQVILHVHRYSCHGGGGGYEV